MNMEFRRKLPIPKEIKAMYPISPEFERLREQKDKEVKDILSGQDDRLLLLVGPCSADNETAVLDYLTRLRKTADEVAERVLIVPRVYTSKPRTTGIGYKGMLHQPDPEGNEDMLKGIIAIRETYIRAMEETGFFCADELLYPENYRYLSDLLLYVAIGARSVENQGHRLTASGLDVAVGMKNPTSGDFSVMMNSITAAQSSHMFIYRNWEVVSKGNPYAHAILRGYMNKKGSRCRTITMRISSWSATCTTRRSFKIRPSSWMSITRIPAKNISSRFVSPRRCCNLVRSARMYTIWSRG